MEENTAKAIKIVVTGPESSGKTTLCQELAKFYQVDFVPEYAREFLEKSAGLYDQNDLIAIAQGQIASENEHQNTNSQLMICDTSLEVIRVWSEWKYKSCNEFILEQAKQRTPNLFLLLKPDLPWQPDPLRENEYDRDKIYDYYCKILKEYGVPIIEINGTNKSRTELAIQAINLLLKPFS